MVKARTSIVMGYLGAVVGAGFASGQEIVQFFVEFGLHGFKGCIVAACLFAFLGGMLMLIAHYNKINNYQDMLKELLGAKYSLIIDLLLAVFLFLGVSLMLSASGAVFEEHLDIDKHWGILLGAIVIVISLFTGKKGLITTFNILVPAKLVLLLAISGYAAFAINDSSAQVYSAFLPEDDTRLWFWSAILYVAYNFALALVVLTEYQDTGSKRECMSGAIWGGLVLGVLVLFNYLALSRFLPDILEYEVPMLYVAGQISLGAKNLYTIVLWVGIITTAIANTYGFVQRINVLNGVNYSISLIITIAAAVPLSLIKFSVLVGKVYPLFGMLGIIIVVALILKCTKYLFFGLYYK